MSHALFPQVIFRQVTQLSCGLMLPRALHGRRVGVKLLGQCTWANSCHGIGYFYNVPRIPNNLWRAGYQTPTCSGHPIECFVFHRPLSRRSELVGRSVGRLLVNKNRTKGHDKQLTNEQSSSYRSLYYSERCSTSLWPCADSYPVPSVLRKSFRIPGRMTQNPGKRGLREYKIKT